MVITQLERKALSECMPDFCENKDSAYCICCTRAKVADYRINDYYEPNDKAFEFAYDGKKIWIDENKEMQQH